MELAHIWVARCRISAGGHLKFMCDFDAFGHFVETDGWCKDGAVHNIFDNPQRCEELQRAGLMDICKLRRANCAEGEG